MPVKKKVHKMDRKLFAASQSWEVQYLLKKYPIDEATLLKIAKKAGRSRKKLTQGILDWFINSIY